MRRQIAAIIVWFTTWRADRVRVLRFRRVIIGQRRRRTSDVKEFASLRRKLEESEALADKNERMLDLAESRIELLSGENEFLTEWRQREISRLKAEQSELIAREVRHYAQNVSNDDLD
jgi:dsDNA-binding SOS-regulon protein